MSRPTRAVALGSITLAGFALALSFTLRGLWPAALLALAAGGLWLLGEWRGSGGAPTLGFLAMLAGAVYGSFEGVALIGLLVALVAALVAWECGRLLRRLRAFPEVAFADELARAHLRRLLLVAVGGLLVAMVPIVVRVQFSFGWALLLAGLAIVGLASALKFFQRESD